MKIFELMKKNGTNELLFFEEPLVGLQAIVAIDNTVLGPALGNCRLYNFKNEEDAIADAINIAYYNTYRSALLRRNFGGGNIVLIGNPKKVKSEMYFRALGIILNKLNGKIFLAKGSGIRQADMMDIRRETNYVLGLNRNLGGSGNTSSNRAKGIIFGMLAAVKEKFDKPNLEGLTVAVQGVGGIGSKLVEELIKNKAKIVITDLIYDKIKVIQDKVPDIKVVKPDEIYSTNCDIFCSCAYEYAINKENAEKLKCKILTGSINNVLESTDMVEILTQKKILYLPGFVINSGDIIQLANELGGFYEEKTEEELNEIYHLARTVIRLSKSKKETTDVVALNMAKEYIDNVSSIKMIK